MEACYRQMYNSVELCLAERLSIVLTITKVDVQIVTSFNMITCHTVKNAFYYKLWIGNIIMQSIMNGTHSPVYAKNTSK